MGWPRAISIYNGELSRFLTGGGACLFNVNLTLPLGSLRVSFDSCTDAHLTCAALTTIR